MGDRLTLCKLQHGCWKEAVGEKVGIDASHLYVLGRK